MGGDLLSGNKIIEGETASRYVEQTLAELRGLGNVRLFTRTTVFGVYDSGVYGALERASQIISAA
jgi:NADPH-dependent 2,4-dienoyl-CoA reductase/sulfur reductase-like enzyme